MVCNERCKCTCNNKIQRRDIKGGEKKDDKNEAGGSMGGVGNGVGTVMNVAIGAA